jgi:pimeloyl-ACP methyl ester carboxylesterase
MVVFTHKGFLSHVTKNACQSPLPCFALNKYSAPSKFRCKMSGRASFRHINKFNNRNMANYARQSQKFTLADGRVLGFAEYGDPEGTPLFFFHGYPSSRLEAGPADKMARRLGVRVIALDRPGFGLSSPQPDRRIIDWPADVQEFAKAKSLPRFSILGGSGGGPFALACAHVLPHSVLTGVGLFASAPPWVAGPQHMPLGRRATRLAANYWPAGLRVVLNATVGALKWLTTTKPVSRRIDGWLEEQDRKEENSAVENSDNPPKEISVKRPTAERRDELLHLLIGEPFAQGAEAAVHEAKLLSSDDWGFRFEDVHYDPVRIWHGAEDKNAPIVMIRYLADRLPHGTLRVFDGDTHYTMFKHLEGALSELVPNSEQRPKSSEGLKRTTPSNK